MDPKIDTYKEEIKTKNVSDFSDGALEYIKTVVGGAYFKRYHGEEKKEDVVLKKVEPKVKRGKGNAHHSDVLTCDLCKQTYTRSHITQHRKTKVHQAYQNINDRLKNMFIPT